MDVASRSYSVWGQVHKECKIAVTQCEARSTKNARLLQQLCFTGPMPILTSRSTNTIKACTCSEVLDAQWRSCMILLSFCINVWRCDVWCSDCQENALKVVSPATVDVLLQTVQNAAPARVHDPCSGTTVTSVKELVLTCLARLVHVINCLQPEQVKLLMFNVTFKWQNRVVGGQPPLSGAPVNKWLSTITRERRIPPDSESGGIPHLFGTSLSPHIGSCPTGSSWQQQQQVVGGCLLITVN